MPSNKALVSPQAVQRFAQAHGGEPWSDDYLRFLVGEVKPLYEPYQLQADQVMRAAGYRHGQDWITRKFPGAEHSERAWRQRVHLPLLFLLEGRIP